MLNKAKIIQEVLDLHRSLKIPLSDIVVSAGAALVLHNARKSTQDIDLTVPQEVFNTLMQQGHEVIQIDFARIITIGLHDLHAGDVHADKLVVVDQGIQTLSIEGLLAEKKMLRNHPQRKADKVVQDDKDIEALLRLLEKQAV